LKARGRRSIKSEDDIPGKVIPDTARANADPLAAQVLEIAYAAIGASDNRKCLRVESDYHAELRIRAGASEWPFTIEGGYGDIGLRKAKRRVAALDASDVLHRAVGTQRDTWRLLMLAVEIKNTADRVYAGLLDTARDPGGESNGVRGKGIGGRCAACEGACDYSDTKMYQPPKRHDGMPPFSPMSGFHVSS